MPKTSQHTSYVAPSGKQAYEYEFFGPYGPAVIICALPLVMWGLVYGCNVDGCLQLYPSFQVPGFPAGQPIYTHQAMLAVIGWFTVILLMHLLLPSQSVQGVLLPDGQRLSYKLNGGYILRPSIAAICH